MLCGLCSQWRSACPARHTGQKRARTINCVHAKLAQALRPCLLWMDVRASAQAARVGSTGDPALVVNGGGAGPVSAEWMIPKALWLKEEEPTTYEAARYICEYQVGRTVFRGTGGAMSSRPGGCSDPWMQQGGLRTSRGRSPHAQDYINHKLTGRMCASVNTMAARWHYNPGRGGWPQSLLHALGMPELASKWPQEVLRIGAHTRALFPANVSEEGGRLPGAACCAPARKGTPHGGGGRSPRTTAHPCPWALRGLGCQGVSLHLPPAQARWWVRSRTPRRSTWACSPAHPWFRAASTRTSACWAWASPSRAGPRC